MYTLSSEACLFGELPGSAPKCIDLHPHHVGQPVLLCEGVHNHLFLHVSCEHIGHCLPIPLIYVLVIASFVTAAEDLGDICLHIVLLLALVLEILLKSRIVQSDFPGMISMAVLGTIEPAETRIKNINKRSIPIVTKASRKGFFCIRLSAC